MPAEAIACKVITTKTSTELHTHHNPRQNALQTQEDQPAAQTNKGLVRFSSFGGILDWQQEWGVRVGFWSVCHPRSARARTAPSSWGGFFTRPLCAAMNKVGIDTGHAGMNRIHCQIRTGPLCRSKHPYSPLSQATHRPKQLLINFHILRRAHYRAFSDRLLWRWAGAVTQI